MIGRIRGILAEKAPAEVLVMAGGVGYEVQIPLSAFERLPEIGEELELHTHLAVREDAQVLFGFPDTREKQAFRHLIKVSGVGPRMALALLSGMSAGELVAAVQGGDVSRLSSVPGIGRKTAERIIVELRDRLDDDSVVELPHEAGRTAAGGGREAEDALVSLGYKQQQAARLIARIKRDHPGAAETEDLIRLALKSMAPGAGSGS
ncbi:MAG: Holliday junction branch migration protein RuvA [Gammaproteobacteria bacterium]|nr:Holliday junction branch migration protein RuvA [Gammaproteobacteria bacterium]MYF00511.1 Holliday junction branch migration protein RuvA [Gammaproteobacteria bacterium]